MWFLSSCIYGLGSIIFLFCGGLLVHGTREQRVYRVSIKAAVASFRFITAIYKFPITSDNIVDVELFLLLALVID